MNKDERIAELENCCLKVWGVMVYADLRLVKDPEVHAAFCEVDALCREAGLMDGGSLT